MQQGQTPQTPAVRNVLAADPGPRASAASGDAVLTLDAWNRMMISAPAVATAGTGALPAGLAAALAVIDAGFAVVDPARTGGTRAVPSAGALHPYECHVITREAVFETDAVRRRVFRTGAADPSALASAGVPAPTDGGAVVVVVTRPWLSMRKYGDRGYLYTQLDTAHLAVNLLGLAAQTPGHAELRLRVRRKPLADLLGITDRCREIHSVLHMAPVSPGARSLPPGWTVYEAGGAERPSWLERLCWESLGQVAAVDTAGPSEPPALPEQVGPRAPLASADPAEPASGAEPPYAARRLETAGPRARATALARKPILPAGARLPVDASWSLGPKWRGLSAGRRSSERFAAGAISGAALGRTLAATRTALACDLPAESVLRLTLVARSVSGLAPGTYRLTGEGDRADLPLTDQDLVRACMHQDHLGSAAAAVLFHIRRDELLGRSPVALREALFRAGGLGQLLYLGATEAGVGVTGVGGFDTLRWQRLGCVPEGDELLYLLLLGADGAPGAKWDRFQTAYAQAER